MEFIGLIGKNRNEKKYIWFVDKLLKVECLLTLAVWSYGHKAEE